MDTIAAKIRNVPDFPQKGIIFKDITPVLQDAESFQIIIDAFAKRYAGKKIDKIAAIESRGFIFGAPLAYALKAGLVIIRKPGKLPYKTYKKEYSLEYGTDAIEIHQDSFQPGERVILIDDLLATGGTALAAAQLLNEAGATIEELAFLIELTFLKGVNKLSNFNTFSFIKV